MTVPANGWPIPTPEIAPPFTNNVGVPSPWKEPNIWSTLFASGVPWQGKIAIRGAKRSYKWDVKAAPGIEGWNQTYRGQPHQNFSIDFFIWTDSMWSYWASTYQLLFQYKGAAGIVIPVKVYHPSLAALGITAIVADRIGAVEQVSDDMMFKATLEVHEYYPPILINATTTPAAASGVNPKIPGVPPPTAIASQPALAKAQAQQAAVLGIVLPF